MATHGPAAGLATLPPVIGRGDPLRPFGPVKTAPAAPCRRAIRSRRPLAPLFSPRGGPGGVDAAGAQDNALDPGLDNQQARESVEKMAREVLSNPIIEDYRVEIEA